MSLLCGVGGVLTRLGGQLGHRCFTEGCNLAIQAKARFMAQIDA